MGAAMTPLAKFFDQEGSDFRWYLRWRLETLGPLQRPLHLSPLRGWMDDELERHLDPTAVQVLAGSSTDVI